MRYLSLLVSMKPPSLMYRKAVPVSMETVQGTKEYGLMKLFLMASSPIAVTIIVALTEMIHFLLRGADDTRTSPSAVVKGIA